MELIIGKPLQSNYIQYGLAHEVVGFSDDGNPFTVKLDLKPLHEYESVITGRNFQSMEGYPLKPYTIRFKTK